MKKYLFLIALAFFVFGCGRAPGGQDILVRINGYEITKGEFERDFKNSYFGRVDTLDSRKDFLDNLINQQLILQDAQGKGLDQEPDFLIMIQKFWEQALLKFALDKKTNEIAHATFVSDQSVQEAYQKMLKEGKTDKPYEQMIQQIRWDITKLKEAQATENWVAQLRKNSKIEVNRELLMKEK